MRVKAIITAMLIISMCLGQAGCGGTEVQDGRPDINRPDESFLKYGNDYADIVELSKINNSVWVHTSYYDYNGSLTPSNGLVVVTEEGLVLVDTPWTDTQMESLDKLAHEYFNCGFVNAVITHAHIDRIGGAGYLRKSGIPATCLERVATRAKELGFTVPDDVIRADEHRFEVDGTEFEIYYPGEGHTIDNTVVWIDRYNLLFAGCMTKEHGAMSLGNTGEANIEAWPVSLGNLLDRYENIEIVVPGHGQWGDKSLIDYTLGLFGE
jgi:metallo-beta-lactamase class B